MIVYTFNRSFTVVRCNSRGYVSNILQVGKMTKLGTSLHDVHKKRLSEDQSFRWHSRVEKSVTDCEFHNRDTCRQIWSKTVLTITVLINNDIQNLTTAEWIVDTRHTDLRWLVSSRSTLASYITVIVSRRLTTTLRTRH